MFYKVRNDSNSFRKEMEYEILHRLQINADYQNVSYMTRT